MRFIISGENRELTELNVKSNSINAIQRGFSLHFPNLIKFDASGNRCLKTVESNVFSECYKNYDELQSLTTFPPDDTTTVLDPQESEFNSKDLIIIMISIVGIALLLFALIFYIHDLILVKETRDAIKQGTAKEIDNTLPDYQRF